MGLSELSVCACGHVANDVMIEGGFGVAEGDS